MGTRRAVALGAVIALMALAWPDVGSAQRPGSGTGLRITGLVGGSVREGPAGFGLARDVVSYGARLTLRRGMGIQPWVQVGGFTRPDLVCPDNLTCNSHGWTVRGGVALPFSPNDTRPGIQPYLLGGLGWGFSEQNKFSVLLGIGFAAPLTPWFAPVVELQWVQLPGTTNILMVNLGLRLDPF